MAFIWNDKPTSPPREMPQAVPPGELSYEVRVIANSVEPSCTVTYNTSNIGFDELCQIPTANIAVAHFSDAFFDYITVNTTATIGRATINVANIKTANILNANIMYGYVGSDPTSNLGIASKHYADSRVANVPSGGSDLQNIIDTKGDLLVGTGLHTATRLPVGTDGQILISDSTAATGLRWIDVAGSEDFHNLFIQTHYDTASNDHVVLLRFASEIVMNDGFRTTAWINKTADIEVSGAGGLDTGVEGPSHWYEVHAIRNSVLGNTALLLHRATELLQDQSLTTTSDTGVTLRRITGGTATKVAQSFVPSLAGPLTSVELEISKTGTPTGLIWVTLEADSGGFPSGTALATSRIMDVARLPTDKARMRFLFDTNTSVSLSTTYHVVYQGDYTTSDANYTTIWGLTANGYASGSASEFRVSWFNSAGLGGASDLWFKTFVRSTPITLPTLPTGYDERCLISYVYNDSAGRFKQYTQKTHSMVMATSGDWRAFTTITGLIEAVDLGPFIPPVKHCSVQFVSYNTSGSQVRLVGVGGVGCTDISNSNGFSQGASVANLRSGSFGDVGYGISTEPHDMIAVDDAVVLTRQSNVDSRLYVTLVIF